MNVVLVFCNGESSCEAIFSNEKKAEKFKAQFPDENWDDNIIMEIDPNIGPLVDSSIYEVSLQKNGEVIRVVKLPLDIKNSENAYELYSIRLERYYGCKTRETIEVPERYLQVTTWAKNSEQAIKIANECKEQLISSNKDWENNYSSIECSSWKIWVAQNFQRLMDSTISAK